MNGVSERGDVSTFSWGLFLALALLSVAVAAGFSVAPIIALGTIIAVAWAFRYIYAALYLGIMLTPFLGIMVSIPTGDLVLGKRAFAGSIDVSLGEIVMFAVLAAWALKLFFQWWRRKDLNWRPRLPLLRAYAFLVAAHFLSAFSPLGPDPVPVAKFAARPVLFDYLAYVALPVNLLRSRRRLTAALGAFAGVGIFAGMNGLLSIFYPSDSGQFFGRAHPFPIFGVAPLGENHNELAELLVATVAATLALSLLVKEPRNRRLLAAAAAFQFVIGLLTFTRTFWIVSAAQAVFLGLTVWRGAIRRHLQRLVLAALFLLPLALGMGWYSLSTSAQSSNSTRLMLTQIAMQVYASSPWFGGGAGTFYERVGSTQVFLLEYGDPLDSHGFLQKLAAETGTIGLIAFGVFVLFAVRHVLRGMRDVRASGREAAYLLVAGAGGAFLYQLFNTSYWTGVMWLPLGLALAGMQVLREQGTVSSEQ